MLWVAQKRTHLRSVETLIEVHVQGSDDRVRLLALPIAFASSTIRGLSSVQAAKGIQCSGEALPATTEKFMNSKNMLFEDRRLGRSYQVNTRTRGFGKCTGVKIK